MPNPRKIGMFADRVEAGARLAQQLDHLKDERPIVIGLPRGGVPVAREIARRLDAPLDVLLVQKIGAPKQPELAIGAVGPSGETYFDEDTLSVYGGRREDVDRQVDQAHERIRQRARELGTGNETPDVEGRTVIVVDDGIATGSTARIAVQILREKNPQWVVLAVPVVAPGSTPRLEAVVDELVYVDAPEPFIAVGAWYDVFGQVSDQEVREMLTAAGGSDREPGREPFRPTAQEGPARSPTRELEIPLDDLGLQAFLTVPDDPRGIVLFAHGTGSGRASPRNQEVARILNKNHLATIRLDLLSPREQALVGNGGPEQDREHFQVLADRLAQVSRWARTLHETEGLPVGTIGSSTGAAVALMAAARHPDAFSAVVSRGGRPDLVGQALGQVQAPTLLIVGGADERVLHMNEDALGALETESRLHVVEGATHLFEEPGTLEEAAEEAAQWFLDHLKAPPNVPVTGQI